MPAVFTVAFNTGKGGTGKTTSAANIAVAAAETGYSVLAVDFDPQADLTVTFGIDEDDTTIVRVEQVLSGGIDPIGAALEIQSPALTGRLRILPTSEDLIAQRAAIARRQFTDLERILDAFRDDTDLVLIDIPGSLTEHTYAGFRAADAVVLPLEPGVNEFRGIMRRLRDLESFEREQGLHTACLAALFVRTPARSRDMREFRAGFADAGVPVFDAHTRNQGAVRNDARRGGPTLLVRPCSTVASDYRQITAEMLTRIATLIERGAEVPA